MLDFAENDKKEIHDAYKAILHNLKYYLQQYNAEDILDYSKIIINMLHSGLLSFNGRIQIDDNYDYLNLPCSLSQGVHVMYGVCCCRHATDFVYDVLNILKLNPSIIWFWVDNSNGLWRKVDPITEKCNHKAILFDNEYVIDPAKKFILRWEQDNGQLEKLDIRLSEELKKFQDDNIDVIAECLKKYYMCRKLGIERVYNYVIGG